MIPIAKPIIEAEEISAVEAVLKSGMLAQGEKVEEFENKFAEYVGTKYAVATSSGTTALHLSLLAAGVKSGDEVITTPFSFISTANSILFVGAKPVFADIDPKTFNISPEEIEKKITSKTKAILPVHLYGLCADMKRINEIAEEHNLIVIEDACQAHGAEIDGKKAGSFGDAAAFSFYPTKNLTTGEGGMITTNNEEIAEKAKLLRNHGQRQRYYSDVLGYNFRMTDIEAAIGIEQLKKLENFIKKRIENATYLTNALSKNDEVVAPIVPQGYRHVFHQYTIRVKENAQIGRDELMKKLNGSGIGTGLYYPLPIYKQKLYREMGYNESFGETEKACKEVLSIPVHPALTKKDLDFIIEKINEFVS